MFITTVFKVNVVCPYIFFIVCVIDLFIVCVVNRLICTLPLAFKVFLPPSSCASHSFSHCKFALSLFLALAYACVVSCPDPALSRLLLRVGSGHETNACGAVGVTVRT